MLWYSAFLFSYLLVFCQARKSTTVVRRCCPDGTALSLKYYQCQQTSFQDNLRQHLDATARQMKFHLAEELSGFPVCGMDNAFLNKNLNYLSLQTIRKLGDFCIDTTTDNDDVMVACVPQSAVKSVSSNSIRIRKCCPMFHMIVAEPLGHCNKTDQLFQPLFAEVQNVSKKLEIFPGGIDILTPGCRNKELLHVDDYGESWILRNGSLYVPLLDYPVGMRSREQYCVDNVDGFDQVQAFSCSEEETPQEENTLEYILIAIGLLISIVFLLATFLIYACELKKQNLYGRTFMCHVASITMAYICLATLQLQPLGFKTPTAVCDIMPYVMLFSFLSAFFWLNVMSIDIWRTFRSIRSRDNTLRGRKMMRFAIYSTYAWGTPATITFCTFMTVLKGYFPKEFLRTCWLARGSYGYYLFFISPISCIILCNIILYVVTAWRCYQVKKDINIMHNADKKQKSKFFKKREQLILNTKLFLVMGITWSMEVISYLFKSNLQDPSTAFIWYITDALNALYGLIIFVIFALKNKSIRTATRRFSTWIDRRRFGSENLMDLRTSTTLNPSTVSTSYVDSAATCQA